MAKINTRDPVNEDSTSAIRRAEVYQSKELAGYLQEARDGLWLFVYENDYEGLPVSLTLPVRKEAYTFREFPPVFEGLLPEGPQLEALLRKRKIDRHDTFTQLVTVGEDLVGSLSVRLPKKAKREEHR